MSSALSSVQSVTLSFVYIPQEDIVFLHEKLNSSLQELRYMYNCGHFDITHTVEPLNMVGFETSYSVHYRLSSEVINVLAL